MKVHEIQDLLDGNHSIRIFDSQTAKEVYADDYDDATELWEKYCECDVLGLGCYSCDEIAVYITATNHYSTWLDLEYSVKVEADVPIGEDVSEYFARLGKSLINDMPQSIVSDRGVKFDLGYDSMESGGFYDNICEEKKG